MYPSSSARTSGSAGSVSWSAAWQCLLEPGAGALQCAFTAVMPSIPATSAAGKSSTSRRISTARCRAGQNLQGSDQRQPHAFPREPPDGRGMVVFVPTSASRKGLEPVDLAGRVGHDSVGSSLGPAESGRQRTRRTIAARRSGRRWWRSDKARSAPTTVRRTRRGPPRPQVGLLDQVPPPRPPSRASGSSARAADAGTARSGWRTPRNPASRRRCTIATSSSRDGDINAKVDSPNCREESVRDRRYRSSSGGESAVDRDRCPVDYRPPSPARWATVAAMSSVPP